MIRERGILMFLFRIVLIHMKHRRLKTALLGIALTLGVTSVVAMLSLVTAMRLELGNELDKFGPNIVVMPRYEKQTLYYGEQQYNNVSYDVKPLTESDIAKIHTIQDRESLNIISPKLVGQVRFNGQNLLMVGLNPKSEFTMKPWFQLAQAVGVNDVDELMEVRDMPLPKEGLILGSRVASQFQVGIGEMADVNGKNLTVAGILAESGGDEDGLVFADLEMVQELLDFKGGYSMIEVSGFCNFCPIEDMASQITDVLPNAKVTALRQAALVREEMIDRFSFFGIILSSAATAVSVLFGISTILSSVNERIQEIGMYRAIGYRRRLLLKLILMESVLISLLAGSIGFVSGTLLAGVIAHFLRQPYRLDFTNIGMLGLAIIVSSVLGLLSSLYPALKAARLDPVDSISRY